VVWLTCEIDGLGQGLGYLGTRTGKLAFITRRFHSTVTSIQWEDGSNQSKTRARTNSVQSVASMGTKEARRIIPDLQFRVLLIGRANAGKTSILQRVCETTESPKNLPERDGRYVTVVQTFIGKSDLRVTATRLTRQWRFVMISTPFVCP
jgi:hypothetical protein